MPSHILRVWEGVRPLGPRGLTCPSRAAPASPSAGAASGPPEPRSSTRRTGSHWHLQSDLGTGRGRWWHCAQPLHKGLEPDGRGGWATRGSQREVEGRRGGASLMQSDFSSLSWLWSRVSPWPHQASRLGKYFYLTRSNSLPGSLGRTSTNIQKLPC